MDTVQTSTNRKPAVVISIDPDELITQDKAAELLHIRRQSLAVWRSEKRGPRWVKCGRRVFYRRADICAWLAAQLSGAA